MREIVEASRRAIETAGERMRRAGEAVDVSRTADTSLAGLADVVRDAVAAAREVERASAALAEQAAALRGTIQRFRT